MDFTMDIPATVGLRYTRCVIGHDVLCLYQVHFQKYGIDIITISEQCVEDGFATQSFAFVPVGFAGILGSFLARVCEQKTCQRKLPLSLSKTFLLWLDMTWDTRTNTKVFNALGVQLPIFITTIYRFASHVLPGIKYLFLYTRV